MDNKTFTRKLAGFKKSATSGRKTLQDLIVAGLEQVQEHGDTVYLTRTLQVCAGVRAYPTNTIKDYIKAHASNLQWAKATDGTMVFKKAVKADAVDVIMPSVPWYDHALNNKNNATDDMDVDKMVNSLLARIQKGIKDGKVKDSAKATAVIGALASLNAVDVNEAPPL